MAIKKQKNNGKFLYLLIILIVFGFIYLLVKPSKNISTTSKNTNNKQQESQIKSSNPKTINTNTLIIGKADAPVTLVEYFDYKCPNCGKFHMEAGKLIQQEYIDGGIVKLELRAYPFLGPDSARALRGSYCADDLGNLVKYHDNVFNYMWENYYKNGNFKVEIEDILTAAKLTEIADLEDSEKSKFIECINSENKNQFIDRDLENAANDGVQGTPTIIINSQKIVGPQPFNIYKQLIDIENR